MGILGCGWLGLPLAEDLLQKGYLVKGSSTRTSRLPDLRQKGIDAFSIRLDEQGIEGPITEFLRGLDILVVNIPPGLRKDPEADFVARIEHLRSAVREANITRLIFVSSISVFGAGQGRVTEKTTPEPNSRTGQQLLRAESLLLNDSGFSTQVLRPGGLLGPDRHPVRSLSGRTFPSGGNQRVNLVELEDVLAALELLISEPEIEGVFHAVYPAHPSKRTYYQHKAETLGIPPPGYSDLPGPPEGREVVSERLQDHGFQFKHPI